MANVNSSLDNWSSTPASNKPATTDSATVAADLQQIQATVRQYLSAQGADIASATTTDLSAATGSFVRITGTTAITGFGTMTAGMWKVIKFTGALTLTYNATSMILPTAANITTAAGDACFALSLGSGNWQVMFYQKADGTPVTFGTVPVASGGTGATTAAGARTNLGLVIGTNVQAYSANTVLSNVATNFTLQQYFGNATLTDAATIAWDVSTAQVATFTFVSSNRTMGAPTNLVNGGFYALAVIQNAGSNTLTWNFVFKWASGTAPTLSTAAGAKDYFTFRSDGTNLYEQGRSLGDA